MAVSATAAVGGLVALTGSLLSYAVARAHGSKRERKLKGVPRELGLDTTVMRAHM